jgi:hypothetical protein
MKILCVIVRDPVPGGGFFYYTGWESYSGVRNVLSRYGYSVRKCVRGYSITENPTQRHGTQFVT